MTISPEALEKARAIVDTVQKSITLADLEATRDCETFIRDKYVNAIAAALQAERDAAAPKLPNDVAALVTALKGVDHMSVEDCFLQSPLFAKAAAAIQSLAARNAEIEGMIRWAHDTLYEINPSNYDHDEVCRVNNASVEVILGLAPILGETHGKTAEWWAARLLNKVRQP